MAAELRAAHALDSNATPALARALTRLVVLPFRVLRPDPETDFLAFSLPDAITASLSAIRTLVVRSSLVAARFAAEAPDFARIAREADVNAAVAGVIVRAGDRLRVEDVDGACTRCTVSYLGR
jgi:TolB-like protein